jgi:exopolysaccharide biosynthesis polyprenyl glycosylphosphotransferase
LQVRDGTPHRRPGSDHTEVRDAFLVYSSGDARSRLERAWRGTNAESRTAERLVCRAEVDVRSDARAPHRERPRYWCRAHGQGGMSSFPRVESVALDSGASAPHVSARTVEILTRRRAAHVPLRRGWLMRRMLLLADVAALAFAFASTELVTGTRSGVDLVTAGPELLLLAFVFPAWVVFAKLHGLYDRDEERADHSTVDEAMGVFHLVTSGIWLAFIVASLTAVPDPPLEKLMLLWVLAVTAVPGARVVARMLCRRSVGYIQNAIVVGAGDVGQLTARKLLNHPEYGINVVGFVDSKPKPRGDDLAHLAVLGEPDNLPRLIRLLEVERVIVAFSHDSHDATLDLVRSVSELDVQIDIVPRLFEVLGAKVDLHNVEGLPLVGLRPLRLSRSSRFMKRAFDLLLTVPGLLLLAPVFAIAAVLVKIDSPGPVFFRQVRRGELETTFRIFKFRTMTVDAEERKADISHLNMHANDAGDPRMFKVPSDPRITRVGRALRRTSIDELPQLFNVLKGEMSLVGPRPLILDEDKYVAAWARRRLDLKPGITGLWQVLGRSDIPFREMTNLDYLYVTNWSLSEDLKLIFRTVPSLLRSRRAF